MISFPNPWELGILVVVVLLVVGPERLPAFAAQLGRLVRELRDLARGATERVREEMGDSFDDLKDLDPRQYDPRRIVREALMDDPPAARPASRLVAPEPPATPPGRPAPSTGSGAAAVSGGAVAAGGATPFDDEAT